MCTCVCWLLPSNQSFSSQLSDTRGVWVIMGYANDEGDKVVVIPYMRCIPFDRIICKRILGLVQDMLARILLRIWNMCNGRVCLLTCRLLCSPLDMNPRNSIDTTCTTYSPATDMFLSTVSLARLLSQVRNV